MCNDASMNIAVIGAGRSRNGIGAYIARYAHAAGARVSAVLDRSLSSARQAARGLQEYGISADACDDFDQFIDRCRPDALVIASPPETHAGYLERALEAGVHVLCEKPFIWNGGCDCSRVAELLESARARGLTVAMNSQWPFVLPAYEKLCGLPPVEQIRSFHIRLAPLSAGRDMIPDSMPHALSLLYSVLGEGVLENLVLAPGSDSLAVSFDYLTSAGRCSAEAHLVRATRQPRPFAFGFNGLTAQRVIDMETYRIAFASEGRRMEIDDPLQLSVNDFLNACRSCDHPLIGPGHILATMRMLQQVYASHPLQPH